MRSYLKTGLYAGVMVGVALGLAACSGIPIRSMARLAKLPDQLLHANPAEVMYAVQMDSRLLSTVAGTPSFSMDILPAVEGVFEPVHRKMPMQVSVTATPAMGLEPAPNGRHWMLYRFGPASQSELLRIQAIFLRMQAEHRGGGGSLAVGIAQDGVTASDASLDTTRWESWLQTSSQEGFYMLWSGTIGELKSQERAARNRQASQPKNN
jgi:hypothetical protein